MALIRYNFRSLVLGYNTNLYVTLPDEPPPYNRMSDDPTAEPTTSDQGKRLYPVLYVLHGATEDATAWLRLSRIEDYCNDKKLITVSIDAHLSMYANMLYGGNYLKYLTEEVPKVVEQTFPASPDREDRFITGFSMGSNGALKAALNRPDLYAACVVMGGATVRPSEDANLENLDMRSNPMFGAAILAYGSQALYDNSENDQYHVARQLVAEGKPKPLLFFACGKEDPLNKNTHEFRDFALELGFEPCAFYEDTGTHSFRFADMGVRKAIYEWLPIRSPKCVQRGE